MSILLIILVLTVNLMPTEMSSFSITMPDAKAPLEFQRQHDGTWRPVGPTAVGAAMQSILIEGTKIKIRGRQQTPFFDLGPLMELDGEPDWINLSQVSVGEAVVVVERRDNGLDLVIRPDAPPEAGGPGDRRVVVHWPRQAAE